MRRGLVPATLGAIVCGSALLHAILGHRLVAPQSLPDELIYSELAKSLGAGELPQVRGDVTFAYGLGYPALLAPIWAALEPEAAYSASKVLNSFVFSLTAVPAFFLARLFVARAAAFVIAAMCVLIPAALYSGMLMTEVALYPSLVLAMLAMAVAIERPSTHSQLAAVGTILLACAIKMLAVAFFAAYVVGILLYSWLRTRRADTFREQLRAYRTTLRFFIVAIAAFIGAAFVSGGKPAEILGVYSVVLDNIDPLTIPWWVLLHLAELDLLLAVVPFAATIVIVLNGLRKTAGRELQLFTALALPVVTSVMLVVGAYSSEPHAGAVGFSPTDARIHGRSTFVLAPLFLVGLGLWVRHRSPFTIVLLGASAAAVLPLVIPIDDFDGNVRIQAQALVPWVALADDLPFVVAVLAFGGTLMVAFVYLTRVRAHLTAFFVPVVVAWAVMIPSVHVSMQLASEWTKTTGDATPPDWIDDAVPADERVSVLWAEEPGRSVVGHKPRHNIVFVSEFFNRAIGDVYEIGSPMPYGLPTVRARVDALDAVIEDGEPLDSFVLAPCYVQLEGDAVARSVSEQAVLVRIRRPARAHVGRPGSC